MNSEITVCPSKGTCRCWEVQGWRLRPRDLYILGFYTWEIWPRPHMPKTGAKNSLWKSQKEQVSSHQCRLKNKGATRQQLEYHMYLRFPWYIQTPSWKGPDVLQVWYLRVHTEEKYFLTERNYATLNFLKNPLNPHQDKEWGQEGRLWDLREKVHKLYRIKSFISFAYLGGSMPIFDTQILISHILFYSPYIFWPFSSLILTAITLHLCFWTGLWLERMHLPRTIPFSALVPEV